jgi:4-amino-4-deoxy-L-arabinose transferase-like glycosyltransferase
VSGRLSRFDRRLAIIAVVAVAVRIAYILIERRGVTVGGDPYFYHRGARLLVEGHGFISPYDFDRGQIVEAADHPPLYLMWLAVPSLVGLKGAVAHMLWSAVAGTASVVVIGLLGRTIVSERVGLIGAAIAAVYPNLFVFDGFLLSETLAILAVSVSLLLAYNYWARPARSTLVWLGVVCALGALSRSELILLVPFLVVPLALLTRSQPVRERWIRAGIASAAAAAVLMPWVGYNLSRFDRPVLLSSQLEITLATTSCDKTFYGEFTGYWSQQCAIEVIEREGEPGADQSENAAVFRREALDYVSDNLGRVPAVVLARWGRVAGLYRPGQQIRLDQLPEGRERWMAHVGMYSVWLLEIGAIAGAIVLRRRRVLLFPFLAPVVAVLIAVTITYGQTRFRAAAEPTLVVLTAVALDAAVRYRARPRVAKDG